MFKEANLYILFQQSLNNTTLGSMFHSRFEENLAKMFMSSV